jgi:phosphomannomutase/phosphoglucomutase
VGHDYRSYSEEIKSALISGLISTGCFVEDIGLSLSPMVYFAQFNLDADGVAMVTASHNENGWTGVKMGIKKGLTHAPDEMKELKEITLQEKFVQGKGNKKEIKNFDRIYKEDLIKKNKIKKKIKAVVACGNGTAGIFAPDILRQIGCEVIELDCNLDWTFPKYNPNPEDLKMLHEIAKAVKENNADIGFGFDGDGDRVGVIDDEGNEIFSDKIGLLIARNLSNKHNNSKFVVDVKSTGLYSNDKVLIKNKCETIYWKTGHSHIKRKVNNEKALAGFEKSGHFFFNQPLGYGYDDGINSAIQVCHLIDNQENKLSEIISQLPKTYQSPTMAPFCKDQEKYEVVEDIKKEIEKSKKEKIKIDNQEISEILTVNGIRFSFKDGSWGLIRASSNKPSLVIVTESPTSDERKLKIFYFIDELLKKTGKIGEYDQKI